MRSAFVKENEPYAAVGVVFVTKTRTCSFPGREEYKKKKNREDSESERQLKAACR